MFFTSFLKNHQNRTCAGCKSKHFHFQKLLLQPWDLARSIDLVERIPVAGWILLYDPKTPFTSRVQVDRFRHPTVYEPTHIWPYRMWVAAIEGLNCSAEKALPKPCSPQNLEISTRFAILAHFPGPPTSNDVENAIGTHKQDHQKLCENVENYEKCENGAIYIHRLCYSMEPSYTNKHEGGNKMTYRMKMQRNQEMESKSDKTTNMELPSSITYKMHPRTIANPDRSIEPGYGGEVAHRYDTGTFIYISVIYTYIYIYIYKYIYIYICRMYIHIYAIHELIQILAYAMFIIYDIVLR